MGVCAAKNVEEAIALMKEYLRWDPHVICTTALQCETFELVTHIMALGKARDGVYLADALSAEDLIAKYKAWQPDAAHVPQIWGHSTYFIEVDAESTRILRLVNRNGLETAH